MRRRALALAHGVLPAQGLRSVSPAALVFLSGHAADGRLRELAAARAAARPVLGALASAFLGGRAHERLGRRSLGDYAREQLGVGARAVREWARVWRALQDLPHLRRAVVAGEVSWTVARLVVGLVTPATDRACLETVRGRTVRAVKALLEAVRAGSGSGLEPDAGDEGSVEVRIPCDQQTAVLWTAALELARRVAGEALPVWQCAEQMAAEAASGLGPPSKEIGPAPRRLASRRTVSADESGLREKAFPGLRCAGRPGPWRCRRRSHRSWRGSRAAMPPSWAAGCGRPRRSSSTSTSRWAGS